jgi:predicted alpha/beta-hydrolase family hydrolase
MRDKHLYDLKLPMLFISGTRDTFAERGLLEHVVERLGNRAALMWIEGGDHSLTVKRGDTAPLRMAADRIEEWINYLAGLK